MTIKDVMHKIIDEQPEDSSFDEIMKELAFSRMIERGIQDADAGRLTSHEDLSEEMKTWQK